MSCPVGIKRTCALNKLYEVSPLYSLLRKKTQNKCVSARRKSSNEHYLGKVQCPYLCLKFPTMVFQQVS